MNQTIVAFAGHMIDAPNRASARFPPGSEPLVATAIDAFFASLPGVTGVCSLANGADILFAEAVLNHGGELHVILPICVEDFVNESVIPAAGPSWLPRFESVRRRATTFESYGDAYLKGSGTPFHVTTLLIDGWAQYLAATKDLRCRSLAVWDAKPGDGFGGTASFVGHSVMQGRHVTCIDPLTGALFSPGVDAIRAAAKHSWARLSTGDQTLEHRLCAMLFADAKGFGGLRESQMPAFIRAVLGAVGRAIARSGTAPRVLNTWGDGLFAVTDDLAHLASLGLALVEEAALLDYAALDLPHSIRFRVGLHAGPAFLGADPITGRSNAYGSDISLAARIEPITPPGRVWASRAFVALAMATGCTGFQFRSVGRHLLAKGAGEMELFELTRA